MAIKAEIEAALNAHSLWRERFKDILNGRVPFDIATINATDQCVFGQWLNNEGYRMIPSQLHDEIGIVHQEFHHIAAEIIQKIKEKRYAEAREDIALEGSLNRKSMQLKALLMTLAFREPSVASALPALEEQAAGTEGSEEILAPATVEALQTKTED